MDFIGYLIPDDGINLGDDTTISKSQVSCWIKSIIATGIASFMQDFSMSKLGQWFKEKFLSSVIYFIMVV